MKTGTTKDLRWFATAFPELADALRTSGVRRLLLAAERVRFEPGASLVRGGESASDLFLILGGTVRITTEADRATELWTVGVGGAVGAAGFVDPGVAELTAVVVAPCTTLWLRHGQLVALAAAEPRVARLLLDYLAAELLRARDRLKTLLST